MEYNKVNMFLGPEAYDWIYKENLITTPSKGKGTTDIKFVSQEQKTRIMSKINLKNRY